MISNQQYEDQFAAEKSAMTALLLALAVQCQENALIGVLGNEGARCKVCHYFIDGSCDMRKALQS